MENTQLTMMTMLILGRHIEGLDLDRAIRIYVMGQVPYPTPRFSQDYEGFAQASDALCFSLNKLGCPQLWEDWLSWQLANDRPTEVKFVRGCIKLASVLESKGEGAIHILDTIAKFAESSYILNDIFNKEVQNDII